MQSNPLRTKMLTSGSLSALQELLASWIAHDRNKDGHYFTSRVPKMAIYGALVSAPLGHFLITILQKAFSGRTSLKAKILQIFVSNLIVCPQSSHRILLMTTNSTSEGVSHTKHCISDLHGDNRRCPELPPGPRHSQSRLHACDESQLDHVAACPGIRPAVLAPADMGAFLQHRRLRHWNIHQCTHQEEAARGATAQTLRRRQKFERQE